MVAWTRTDASITGKRFYVAVISVIGPHGEQVDLPAALGFECSEGGNVVDRFRLGGVGLMNGGVDLVAVSVSAGVWSRPCDDVQVTSLGSDIAVAAGWGKLDDTVIGGDEAVLSSDFPCGALAAVALARTGIEARKLAIAVGGQAGRVRTSVNDGAGAVVGFGVQRLDGKPTERTNVNNPFVERYRTVDDRWIYLHGGMPGLKRKLCDVLNLPDTAERTDLDRVVRRWYSDDLEDRVAAEGGCSAIIRTEGEWREHPHGSIVHGLPVSVETVGAAVERRAWQPSSDRPLRGLRVLDLTRILAGPTCGRTLAALGADVLHVRGPEIPSVPAFVMDTGQGKRQAFCDFTDASELAVLRSVALDADVVVQGYRPGVAAKFGLDENSLRNDGYVGLFGSISAFGPIGPWSERAGWEQLAQSASGLCSGVRGERRPTMLPGAVTDYVTGFVLAGSIIAALRASMLDDRARRVDAALCMTAAWLLRVGRRVEGGTASGLRAELRRSETEWGILEHLGPGFAIDGIDVGWDRPSAPLGSGQLTW